MSKVVFMDPIDHVSGKLSKNSRVTYCYRHPGLSEKGEDRRYTQIRGKRSTPYTAAELAVAAVMKNPASLQTAQAEFAAQTTFKKLRNYLWDREWSNYAG